MGFYFSHLGSPLTSYHHLSLTTFHFGNYEKFCGPRVIDISIDIFELLHNLSYFYTKINIRFLNQQGKEYLSPDWHDLEWGQIIIYLQSYLKSEIFFLSKSTHKKKKKNPSLSIIPIPNAEVNELAILFSKKRKRKK